MRKKRLNIFYYLCFTVGLAALLSAGPVWTGEKVPDSGPAAVKDAGKGRLVYRMLPHSIKQMEDEVYAAYLIRGLDEAQAAGADAVIIEINTPGGEMLATFDISDKILRQTGMRTIAFVNTNAISAGSLIALSCNKIAMAPGGVIGSATPVLMGGGKVSHKIIETAIKKWRSAAEANGKDPDVAERMVVDTEILYNTFKKENKKQSLQKASKKKKKKGKGPSIDEEEKQETIDKWLERRNQNNPVVDYKPLALSTKEALKAKIADYKATSLRQILKKEGLEGAVIVDVKYTFGEEFTQFLINPLIAGLLLVIGFVGLLTEVRTPGWGVGGTVAIIFLTTYFLSRVLAGYSGWGAPALFAVGLILLALEIFVIPGFGIAGIGGIALLGVGILWAYGLESWQEGVYVLAGALTSSIVILILLFRHLQGSKLFSRMILAEIVPNAEDENRGVSHLSLNGQTGTALTDLRPSGTIEIEGRRLDAISEGGYINKGTPIKVVLTDGNRIVVVPE